MVIGKTGDIVKIEPIDGLIYPKNYDILNIERMFEPGGISLDNNQIKEYLFEYYSDTDNEVICKELGISIHQLRRFVSKWGIRKSKQYLEKKMIHTRRAQQEYFRKRIKPLIPTIEQFSIILGSLLGDATLSKGPRSKYHAYKEHFSVNQKPYREWKQKQLEDLGFHFTKSNRLYSYSHPLFSELYQHFYQDSKKVLPAKLLPLMQHPLFLATLYLDDGSLLIWSQHSQSKIYLYSTIAIYSQSFTQEENDVLRIHLNESFGTNFVLSRRPDGCGHILKLNKEEEVRYFLNLIKPYVQEIESMRYKFDLDYRLKIEQSKLLTKFPSKEILFSSSERNKAYSQEEIRQITNLRKNGMTWPEIAEKLNRTYWSIMYKARELGLTKKHHGHY